MSFKGLLRRVDRAEQLLEGRRAQTRASWHTLSAAWREGWTPLRIVVVGLAAGFMAGRAEPLSTLSRIGGARWMQIIGTVSSMVASLQAAASAQQAHAAAEQDGNSDTTATPATDAAARPSMEDPVVAPRPAEAATEMSEP